MRQLTYILIALVFLSCKSDYKESKVFNLSKKFENQNYEYHFLSNLDTILISKKGNKYFLNNNSFKKYEKDTIEVRIFEFFEKSNLIKNNIRTLTEKGELLESKGVIKIEFYTNSEKIKDDKKIKVVPVSNNYLDCKIYYDSMEDVKQINWKEQSDMLVQIEYPNPNYGFINTIIEIPLDSLEYHTKIRDSIYEKFEISELEKVKSDIITFFSINNNLLINIDKLIDTPLKKDLNFNCKPKDKYEDYIVYVIYENLNSFVSFYLTGNDLTIKQLPITGNAKGIIVTYADDKVLYDEFIINENSDNNIKINLKQIELEAFKEILTSY